MDKDDPPTIHKHIMLKESHRNRADQSQGIKVICQQRCKAKKKDNMTPDAHHQLTRKYKKLGIYIVHTLESRPVTIKHLENCEP